jgi:hypothetical protein
MTPSSKTEPSGYFIYFWYYHQFFFSSYGPVFLEKQTITVFSGKEIDNL